MVWNPNTDCRVISKTSKEISRYRNKGRTPVTWALGKQQRDILGTATLVCEEQTRLWTLARVCWASWKNALVGTWLPLILQSLLGKPRVVPQHSSDLFAEQIPCFAPTKSSTDDVNLDKDQYSLEVLFPLPTNHQILGVQDIVPSVLKAGVAKAWWPAPCTPLLF